MRQEIGASDERVLEGVRVAISETLGLLEDEHWIMPTATLADDLGITSFELLPILVRLEAKVGKAIACERIAEQLRGFELNPLTHAYTVANLVAAASADVAPADG